MNKRRVAMGAVGALLLPVLLAFAAYFVSARSFATTKAVSAPLSKLGRPRRSPSPSPRESSGSDVSGNCDEAEHQNDPACAGPSPSATKDDSGGGGSDSGKSGSGDSGSGKSGDSDGSGDSDSSGPGSGSSGGDD